MLHPRIFKAVGLVLLGTLVGCGRGSDPASGQSARPWSGSLDAWSDHKQGLPFIMGYEQGLEASRAQGKPAMMFVTTTWCSWCKRLSGESFQDETVKKLLQNFVLVIVDGDVEREALVKLRANEGFPHVVFLSQGGQRIGECKGYKPVEEFKRIVESALSQS